LEDEASWIKAVERWATYSDEQLIGLRESALSYAQKYLAMSPAVQQNRDLFTYATKK